METDKLPLIKGTPPRTILANAVIMMYGETPDGLWS